MLDPPDTPRRRQPLVVCERTGAWAFALRAALGEDQRLLYETRNFDDFQAALLEAPHGMAAIEAADSDLDPMLGVVVDLSSRQIPVVVLAAQDLSRYDPLFREAGAVHVVYSRRNAGSAVKLFRRRLLEPLPEQSLLEEIWQRLPWKRG